jgi:hypothetical protein
MLETSYTSRPTGSPGAGRAVPQQKAEYWPLSKLRKAYTSYLTNKREEINEQIDARRYYHASQFTAKQAKIIAARGQPLMTFNRIGPKIDSITGLVESQRRDPKAYARTQQHEQGAELATAVVRYVLDEQRWNEKSPVVALDAAIDGIGGMELDIIEGDRGDHEIGLDVVDITSFFYDPHSSKADFSDARYMGVGKWLDHDVAQEMFPDAPEGALQSDEELVVESDKEARWFRSDGVNKRVRVVECWYKHNRGWCWAVFSGHSILKEGKSPFKDNKRKDICKYVMYSASVDQDGDRYGFVRNMKSAQDGINAKQSKMQHMIASNRLFVKRGMVDNVEKTRAEYAKADGVIEVNGDIDSSVKESDKSFDFTGLGELLKLNYEEIERFGPNPALVGDENVESTSGRAIALLQQAGMKQLGPYLLGNRGWKLRLYRAIFSVAQQVWTGERTIRVTDNEQIAQFIEINKLQSGPLGPQLVNALGSLDVDIILDEGPDTITMQQDQAETAKALAASGVPIPPQVLIELSPLDSQTKRKVEEIFEQAAQQNPQIDPAQAKLAEVEMNGKIKVAELEQEGQLKQRQIEQEGALKNKQIEMEAAHKERQLAIETNLKRQQAEQDEEIAFTKHDSEMRRAGEKHDQDRRVTEEKMQIEREARAEKAPGGGAEVNKVAKQLVAEFKAIGEDIKTGVVEGVREIVSKPRKVTVVRDKTGRIVGGESA